MPPTGRVEYYTLWLLSTSWMSARQLKHDSWMLKLPMNRMTGTHQRWILDHDNWTLKLSMNRMTGTHQRWILDHDNWTLKLSMNRMTGTHQRWILDHDNWTLKLSMNKMTRTHQRWILDHDNWTLKLSMNKMTRTHQRWILHHYNWTLKLPNEQDGKGLYEEALKTQLKNLWEPENMHPLKPRHLEMESEEGKGVMFTVYFTKPFTTTILSFKHT
ncbi:uncharacterized protein LOC119124958 isoform X3 [Syngnathus acus]|uniref:uncharacterized protein LOC119124958 isoform X3 n=1 Tax=Syngnathus acus TaxID=161584 RepID=UPI0018864C9D|nr:uncharacterized protein LOC119124958 isoform X3 [Syngnathus acus]